MCLRTHLHLLCTRYRWNKREMWWQTIRFDQKIKTLCSLAHFILVSHHFYSTTTNRQKVHFWMQPFRISFPNTSTWTTIYSNVFVFVVCFDSVRFGLLCLFSFLLFSVVYYQCIENVYIVVLYTQSLGRAWVSFSRTLEKFSMFIMLATHSRIYTHFCSP